MCLPQCDEEQVAGVVIVVAVHQAVRLLVNDRKFSAENSVFLSHQTSQQ